MIHSTFFILGDRETKGDCLLYKIPPTFFTASHPLPISTPPPNNIHGNKGRDKKRSFCFHNLFPSLNGKNFCSAIVPVLSLPSYNDLGWTGCAFDMSSALPPFRKASQGVSSHLSLDSSVLTSITLQNCYSNTKWGGTKVLHFLRLSYINLTNV